MAVNSSAVSTPSFSRKQSKTMTGLCFRTMANYLAEDDLPALLCYLDNRNVVVDDRDDNGQTLLMVASQRGKKNFVKELLTHGADVNAVDYDNWTALLNASKEGHIEVVMELLDHNASIEHKDMGGWTALMWACYKGRTNIVRLLLEIGADSNVHGQYNISCLMWAAGRGYTDIVKELLSRSAKVNVGDKYGTTALIWACRRGHLAIVEELLKAGSNVDTTGMNSWTPVLVATMGNYIDIVQLLLEHKPNVNAIDKDGCSALTVACREGYTDIVVGLLNAGAYVNLQDRAGDTNLIHAAKAGHLNVVESLIKKYADVDVQGADKKTALYWAVEKGYAEIVKAILRANPDTELCTKDGDSPLMKATRNRNTEIVQMLVDKKSKVSVADKKGDTALHIAMRSRSKAIVEILLRNPKNSQLLYRPNRAGETPYNIDTSHQKSILGQIFGARRLNTNEDNENMLGYDLYGSALADFLSEPTLSMPICVGLYAKWGSGKSFLLGKLRDEMTNFARQWIEPELEFSWLLFLLVVHLSGLLGIIIGVILVDYIVGLAVAVSIFSVLYLFLAFIWTGVHHYDFEHAHTVSIYLARKLASIKLFLQVLFCHPSTCRRDDSPQANPIHFLFTDQAKVSSTGSDNSVAFIIASLYDSLEKEYGVMTTRLFTVFKPKPVTSSSWKWRHICCLPYFFIFYATLACIVIGIILFVTQDFSLFRGDDKKFTAVHGAMIFILSVTSVIIIANIYTWIRMISALVYPTKKRLFRAIANAEISKIDDLQAQHSYVQLMAELVQCLDAFTGNQTRLVIIVDGLDSCEQEKVLHNLDAVHLLFSDPNTPFITILAIDPHIIIKAIETNINRVFHDFSINGHDYLRNVVHLPFYLQNSGLRRVKVAQNIAAKKMNYWSNDDRESFSFAGPGIGLGNRRLSSESSMSIPDRIKQARKNSKKLRVSESVASSMGNLNYRVMGAQDLTKVLLTDDYFSDVNPRSMRRLMNVVYITGRLLKAFNIDFNWYHLAIWVNIIEQWPYRTSWITLYYEKNEDDIEDNISLKSVYEKVSDKIPTSKEIEPLLEIDRDERKFEIFLSYHKASLQIADLKMFLPFTINLDPYIRKVIKEEQQNIEEMTRMEPTAAITPVVHPPNMTPIQAWSGLENKTPLRRPMQVTRPSITRFQQASVVYPQMNPVGPLMWNPYPHPMLSPSATSSNVTLYKSNTILSSQFSNVKLSSLSVSDVCDMLKKLEGVNASFIEKYCNSLKENNIHGQVLLYCDLNELKNVLQMSFGDWELFRISIICLRDQEQQLDEIEEFDHHRNVHFTSNQKASHQSINNVSSTQSENNTLKSPRDPVAQKPPPAPKPTIDYSNEKNQRERSNSVKRLAQQNTLEKQVTLEEQMIMGALQTLNEDAQEQTREEVSMNMHEMAQPPSVSTLSPILSDPDEGVDAMSDVGSIFSAFTDPRETDVLYIQTPPLSPRQHRCMSMGVLHDDRSPRRVVIVAGGQGYSTRSPSPMQQPRFSLASVSSSQASGIEMIGLEEPAVKLSTTPPELSKPVRPVRPNNLSITPAPSCERLNKLKNKLMNAVSPPRSITPSPRIQAKKIISLHTEITSDTSDEELNENTPLVSPVKTIRQFQKPTTKSTHTLTQRHSVQLNDKPKELASSSTSAFTELSPRKKLDRSSVSFDDGKIDSSCLIDSPLISSEHDLHKNKTRSLIINTDFQSNSVPVTPTTDLCAKPREFITSTETVI